MNQSDRTPENRSRQTSSTGEEQKIESGCTVASGLSTFMKAVKKDGAGWADSASGVEVSWFSVREKSSSSILIGKSEGMGQLMRMIRKVSEFDADVLIVGETGTGKELTARCIHEQSPRRQGNFVAVNCCAIPENILESELFGHELGAFTGALRQRIGKFEYAHKGTLFLDEIDGMPLHLQVKLLRVLQERSLERLGSNETIPINVRIVASTKKDLKTACARGSFREDLFYRLNVLRIGLPPLRDRRDDIPLLFQYFVLQACSRYQRKPPSIPGRVWRTLVSQSWPGNVRELKNFAERFALGCPGELQNLEPEETPSAPEAPAPGGQGSFLTDQVHSFEKALIEQELKKNRGDIKETYTVLGLPRKTLYDKMKKYGLKRADFITRRS